LFHPFSGVIAMKSLLFAAAIVIAMTLPSIVAAQSPPSQYEHLKALEDHIGTWEGEFETPTRNGMTHLKVAYEWILNRSYIRGTLEMGSGSGEELVQVASLMYGWDGASQRLHGWGFWTDEVQESQVSIDGNRTHVSVNGVSADGASSSFDVYHTIVNDAYTLELANRKHAAESLPDIKAVLRRVK
jgi:hypothetical protein